MKKIFLFLLITFLLTACGKKCYNSPQPIAFEFVDADGENMITNGTLPAYSISENASNGDQIGVELTKTTDDKVILEGVGAYHGTKYYTFYSGVKVFDFSIESSEFNAGCEGYQINKLTFQNVIVTDENGYYKIQLVND